MLYQLLRTSLRRSNSILNVSVRGASTTYVAPRALLVGTRSFSAAFALRAASAKGATDEKTTSQTTTSKNEARKKATAAKKPSTREKGPAKKVVKPKKKLAAKAVKPKRLFKKDLTPPFKRPETAWMKFVRESYQQHKDTHPALKEYLTKASADWKQMTDEQKAAYNIPQQQAWDDYSKKRSEWKASLPRNIRLAIRSRRKDYRSGQKSPLNPWFQYIKENYHKHPFPDTATTNAAKFKSLYEHYKQFVTDAEKQELAERATREFAGREIPAKETATS